MQRNGSAPWCCRDRPVPPAGPAEGPGRAPGATIRCAGGAAQAAGCQTAFTETRGPSALVATGDSCANARKVSTRVSLAAPAGCVLATTNSRSAHLRKPCVRLGYTCTAVATKRDTLRVTCTRDARRIRFTY
jgi:hypothetical protein